MPHEVVSVAVLSGYRLRLRFEDGHVGTVDLATRVGSGGVFDALIDPEMFRSVKVHRELGTICWPNGADLCPDLLYRESGGGGR